jgi:hypothetical protein
LNTAKFTSSSAANTAISNGSIAKATAELAALELCQLGYIIYSYNATGITQVTISKSTLKQTLSTGGTNTAALVNTVTTNFDGILSVADTNVQAALETIDNWGKVSTNHGVLIGQGVGVAINATAAGTANQFLISGGASADPAWSTWTMPATPAQGDILYASSATVMSQLAKDASATRYLSNTGTSNNPAWAQIALATGVSGQLPVGNGGTGASTLTIHGLLIGNTTSAINAMAAGTAGQLVTSGGASADPAWTTATYPTTIAKGEILVASAADTITALTAGTADYVLTAHGAGNAVTWEAASGGGIGTLAGDSGTATGGTVTIAGGTNITTTAATATVTINLDAAITGTTSITGANGCELRTGTTAADTLLISAYDVDGTAYVPFITLTANNTPTMDLGTTTTIGGANIYRAGGTDVAVADGGTGASTLTQNGVLYGNATSAVGITAEGGTGTILVGTASAAPSWLATGAEGKVLTSHNGTALTWETPSSGATWMTKATATADGTAAVNYSYTIIHGTPANLLTLTLPATAAVNDRVAIIGYTAGMWKLVAASGDTIKVIGATTSAGGYIAATTAFDCVEVVCVVADTTWVACSSMGNLTIA